MRNIMEPLNKLKISKEKNSAFHKYEHKRDSGYQTDNSPALPHNQLQFKFDEEDIDVENVHVGCQLLDTGEISDDCFEDQEEMTDNVDKEVECAMSYEGVISVPIPIVRPCAPAPAPLINNYNEDCISETKHFTTYRFQRELHQQNKSYFRPIGRRTTSTQTPHQNSQIIKNAVSVVSDRFHPYDAPVGRGTVYNRLRHNSDDCVPHSPLPDVVPSRDRSVSLPDVPALREAQETEVGRELRRISDEFHFSYHSPRQARIVIRRQPGSFPGPWRLGDLWESLRQIFTPSPTNH